MKHEYEGRLSPELKRRMAADEGTRVIGLSLNLLAGEFGAARTNAIARGLEDVPTSTDFERRVLDALRLVLEAATSHAIGDLPSEGHDLSTDDRNVGAIIYSSTLELLRREVGDERTRELADRMDELSVEGTDVFAVREMLGLPDRGKGPGTMEDWANFIGSAWSIIADPSTDWSWTTFSEDRSVMTVTRCPYWSTMTDKVRALKPCEHGCSSFVDTAAQKVNPEFRLRGDPAAAPSGKGYARSLPKGDGCCELEISRVTKGQFGSQPEETSL